MIPSETPLKVKDMWFAQMVGKNIPDNQRALGQLLRAKGCSVFNFTERYDVRTDDMLLCCTGYVVEPHEPGEET